MARKKLHPMVTGLIVAVGGGLILKAMNGGTIPGLSMFSPASAPAGGATSQGYAAPLTMPVAYNPQTQPAPVRSTPRPISFIPSAGSSAPSFDPALVDVSSVMSDGIFFSVY